MGIELYWGSGSPFAWRVMLILEVKGLAYESRFLEFSKGEHQAPAYLQLNPRGKVPLSKDGDFVIYESLAIMSYLDRKYPDPPLFGEAAEETGLIWRSLAECESYIVSAGDKVVRPIFFCSRAGCPRERILHASGYAPSQATRATAYFQKKPGPSGSSPQDAGF